MPFLSVGGNFFFFYILIDRVLRKVEADEASGILIVPQWTTQPRFPVLMGLLVRNLLFCVGKRTSSKCHTTPVISIHSTRGWPWWLANFQDVITKLKTCRAGYWNCHVIIRDQVQPRNNTRPICHDGTSFQLNGLVIPCKQLWLKLWSFFIELFQSGIGYIHLLWGF